MRNTEHYQLRLPDEDDFYNVLDQNYNTEIEDQELYNLSQKKVDKIVGKGLSANDFTTAYKTKLDGIAVGAGANVQADWDVTASNSDAFIKNKPSIPAAVAVKGNAESTYRTGNVNLTAEQIGAFSKYNQTIDLSEAIYDQSKWYPVTGSELPITKLSLIDVEVALNSDTKPSWSTHDEGFSCSLTVLTKGHGYGKTNGETIVLNHGCRWTDNVNPCGFSQLTYSSMPVLWLRGGGKYFVNTSYNCAWTPRTSTFNPNNYGQTVAPTTAFPGVAFPVKDTIYANLNGTASAAAKLSTARKIGNASFDGSKDISVIGMGASPLVSTYISPVSAGWYRFAKFQAGNAAGAQGAVDLSCIISLKRTFANGTNETHRIQFLGVYQNAKFVPITSRTNTHTITKIRYVTEGSTAYLDFYYARSVQNDIRISIEDPIASDGRIWSALPLTLVPETAAGITVHASMDIPNTTANMVTLFNGRYELDTDSVCDIALGSFPYDIYAVTTTYGVFLIDGSTSGFRKAMHIRNLTSSVVIGSMSIQIQKNGTNYSAHFYSLKENTITGSSATSNAASLDITNIVGYQFN